MSRLALTDAHEADPGVPRGDVAQAGLAEGAGALALAGAKVFISYSRKDLAFLDRLDRELRDRGIETLVDRQEIYAFEDWWARIQGLIAQADTILFVLTPDAIASEVCRKEVAFAETLNKRFAPVVARAVDPNAVPGALQRLNFVFLDREETYPAGLDRLVEALATDIDWVRRHSGYGEAARLWAEAGRSKAHLLGARQLEEAERWIESRPANAPVATEDMQALLVASRAAAKQRRRLIVLSLVLGLVFALGLASVAFWQRQVAVANEDLANRQTALATLREQEATRERDRAQRALDNAKSAADGLIFDLAQGLRGRGLPVAIVRAVLERSETLMTRLVEAAPDDPGLLRSQAAMYAEFADTYASAGATDRQKDAALRATAILRRLAAQDAADPAASRDLSVSLTKVGEVQVAGGDLAGALASYEESFAIRRRLAERYPADPVAARDLSVSLERIGDVRVARGDLAGALARYEDSLAIARRLATEDPSGDDAARDLSVSLTKVGDVRLARGDLAGAQASYAESLVIARRLSAKAASDAGASRDLALSLERIGDVQVARGDHAGALPNYEECLAIRRRLAAQDPSNAEASRDLALSLDKVGDVQLVRGDRAGALANYTESLAIRRRLAGKDPSNAVASSDLALSLNKVGDVQVARGDLAGALANYEESLAIRRRLAVQDPSNAVASRDLSVSLIRVGDVGRSRGDLAGAAANYTESLAIRRRLAAQDPSEPGAARDVAASLSRLAQIEITREHYPEACRDIAEGYAILRPLRDRPGLAKAIVGDLTWFETNKAACDLRRAEELGARAYTALMARDFAGALTMSEEAVALAPDLIWLRTNSAHALMMLGRTDEARAIYLRYRGQIAQDDKTWETIVADDFGEMRKAGLTHALMDDIEAKFAKPK